MIDYYVPCTPGCSPMQILNLNLAVNNIDSLEIYDECGAAYDLSDLKYSYSVDNACWTCYMSYSDFIQNIPNDTDFYLRIKVKGPITSVKLNGSVFSEYSTQLDSSFNFSYCSSNISSNTFNPYANLDCAVSLQQYLSETVSCLFGVSCYYFKLTPETKSKDISFKEYTIMNVEAVKQIKLIISDGIMPSSKPEFSDFGLDWQTDWETEISKGTFATAFGETAQPMEGDLIYIPMMKRMWMVNEAYEEKNESLMWNATTFKLALVKYQEKDSVNLGDTEDMVNSLVKNKYEELFGNEEVVDSGEEGNEAPRYAANNLYSVFESDATRKYVTCDPISISNTESLYYKGTLIADSFYSFSDPEASQIIYQREFCGTDGVISFIIKPFVCGTFSKNIINIGKYFSIDISQSGNECTLSLSKMPGMKITLKPSESDKALPSYFVILRWSKSLNIAEFSAYKYTRDKDIPDYKINMYSYYFDIDNPVAVITKPYDNELIIDCKSEISLQGFYGTITNIKVFDIYNDNISQIMQMFPTHQHLLINDVARKLVDGNGVALS